jgi:hypothetical protein
MHIVKHKSSFNVKVKVGEWNSFHVLATKQGNSLSATATAGNKSSARQTLVLWVRDVLHILYYAKRDRAQVPRKTGSPLGGSPTSEEFEYVTMNFIASTGRLFKNKWSHSSSHSWSALCTFTSARVRGASMRCKLGTLGTLLRSTFN